MRIGWIEKFLVLWLHYILCIIVHSSGGLPLDGLLGPRGPGEELMKASLAPISPVAATGVLPPPRVNHRIRHARNLKQEQPYARKKRPMRRSYPKNRENHKVTPYDLPHHIYSEYGENGESVTVLTQPTGLKHNNESLDLVILGEGARNPRSLNSTNPFINIYQYKFLLFAASTSKIVIINSNGTVTTEKASSNAIGECFGLGVKILMPLKS